MNMNIQPAAASTVKGAGHSKPTGAAALLADLDAGNATQDFASQLEAQLGPKLSSQLGQLGQQLAAKGQVVDKNSLTQAVNTGEQEGTLSLDDNQLSQIMAAIQALPNGNLKTADASQLKNAALSDKEDAKDPTSQDANALPIQALFAMLAAQPAAQVTPATAQNGALPNSGDSKDKTALLQSLSGDAKSLLTQGDDKAAEHKTAVTDTSGKGVSQHGDARAASSKSSDFNNALTAMSTANGAASQQPNSELKNSDNGALLQNINQINSAAMAASSVPVSSTPTSTTLVSAPNVPQLNAQLGSPEWQQQLGQQVLMFNRQGQQTAELRLHPQDLGSIQISMKIEDGQAQMHFVSGHSGVRAALEAAMPQLRTSLADSGINLNQTNVSSDTSQWQQASNGAQQQFGQQSGSSQGSDASWAAFNGVGAASASDALPVPASLQQLASGKGGVDIFA
ncbi:flagellar hook-length control protein FliK [Ewingella sp. AOP8-B2-18]